MGVRNKESDEHKSALGNISYSCSENSEGNRTNESDCDTAQRDYLEKIPSEEFSVFFSDVGNNKQTKSSSNREDPSSFANDQAGNEHEKGAATDAPSPQKNSSTEPEPFVRTGSKFGSGNEIFHKGMTPPAEKEVKRETCTNQSSLSVKDAKRNVPFRRTWKRSFGYGYAMFQRSMVESGSMDAPECVGEEAVQMMSSDGDETIHLIESRAAFTPATFLSQDMEEPDEIKEIAKQANMDDGVGDNKNNDNSTEDDDDSISNGIEDVPFFSSHQHEYSYENSIVDDDNDEQSIESTNQEMRRPPIAHVLEPVPYAPIGGGWEADSFPVSNVETADDETIISIHSKTKAEPRTGRYSFLGLMKRRFLMSAKKSSKEVEPPRETKKDENVDILSVHTDEAMRGMTSLIQDHDIDDEATTVDIRHESFSFSVRASESDADDHTVSFSEADTTTLGDEDDSIYSSPEAIAMSNLQYLLYSCCSPKGDATHNFIR